MELTKDFFDKILDFGEEWEITGIETDPIGQEVYIDIAYTNFDHTDTSTGRPAKLYDHTPVRQWRHLDMLQYKCFIRGAIPRIKCDDGTVKQLEIPWAKNFNRYSYLFEILVIKVLQATKNQTQTANLLRCGFGMVNRILHKSTERGLERRDLSKREIRYLSIDEKSFKKGQDYITVLSDPVSAAVLDVAHGRDTHTTKKLLRDTLDQEQRKGVGVISMDMWKPYINAAKEVLPDAEQVHDKFHLIAYLNKSIDQVRRRETKKNPELKGSRYALLKNQENLTEKQQTVFQEIKQSNLDAAKTWYIRENFKSLFGITNYDVDALGLLKNWANDSFMQGIKEVNKVVLMFLSHAKGIVNSLISTITNAMAERLNGKIQEIKTVGRGYRTFKNFRSAILFFHGKLDLYPLTSQ